MISWQRLQSKIWGLTQYTLRESLLTLVIIKLLGLTQLNPQYKGDQPFYVYKWKKTPELIKTSKVISKFLRSTWYKLLLVLSDVLRCSMSIKWFLNSDSLFILYRLFRINSQFTPYRDWLMY